MLKAWGDLCHIRQDTVSGFGPWVWRNVDLRAGDGGAWKGPKEDWETRGGHVEVLLSMPRHRTVIQAGGNQGMYPRLLAEAFERVYTFEPDGLNFFCLVQNCQKDNIFKFQAAVGHTFSFVDLDRQGDNTGGYTIKPGGSIPIVPIDAFGFQDVDLIMLDVERAELSALHGATETIKRSWPVIVLECGNTQDIQDFLIPLGYQMTGKAGSYDYVWRKLG
jgi:FkbM family methyltransferase